MLAQAIVEFFKYKVVSSIIILTCWPPNDQIKLHHQLTQFGISSTFSCNPTILDHVDKHRLQGVLYFTQEDDNKIWKQVDPLHFISQYKWLIVGDRVPDAVKKVRYDADMTFLSFGSSNNNITDNTAVSLNVVNFQDIYIHPRDGIAVHPWAYWSSNTGLVLTHEREKILRRQDLKKYPLRIATPVGHYSVEQYHGSFVDWLDDESISEADPGIRCGYHTSMLLIEALNAQDVLIANELWAAEVNNNSMYVMLTRSRADLSGGILRILVDRIYVLDYIVAIWPFRVGFTYLAERESSTNMYLEPFSPGVWWATLATMGILAFMQRITAKTRVEQDGALYTVLTTYLQQDASAVPQGISGRWAFTVMSMSAMLVHAYYTSAIVSALMSTGRGGPDSLRALGDSKYSIASEDYDYMRYLFFDVETAWDDLEYLKKKKMTSKFYQDLEKGVELIEQGNTAFHSEYNQIYPHFKRFSDDHICKLQHVDTIPKTLTYITSSKDGQWTSVLRVAGAWILENGLGKRLVDRLKIPQPPCRAALLAERVKLGDVTPLILLSIFGAVLSCIILGMEIMFAKTRRNRGRKVRSDATITLNNDDNNISDVVEYDIN